MKPLQTHSFEPDDAGRRQFLQFIRQVNPKADPTSVLLFMQMMHTSNLLVQAAEQNLCDTGLSWAKFRLLMSLGRAEQEGATEGVQPSELSDLQEISRNTVSALIASLEKDGLISRELHDTDRRRFLIRLTPEGRKVLRAKMADHFQFVTECFGVFESPERQKFLEQLCRLKQSLVEQDDTHQ